MAIFAVQRLTESVRSAVMAHLLALPLNDRYLRFGASLPPGVIAAYVDGIDFDRDAVFGVQDDRLELVGVAHVAIEGDQAEVGLSVVPGRRGRGVGRALFERALAHARNRCVPRLFMQYLSGNTPMMRIARRFRMDIVAGGSHADARLELPPPNLRSIAGEFLIDTFGLCDRALKTLLIAWRQQRLAGRRG
jgi:GNAT superfamily N-acetyltransferase